MVAISFFIFLSPVFLVSGWSSRGFSLSHFLLVVYHKLWFTVNHFLKIFFIFFCAFFCCQLFLFKCSMWNNRYIFQGSASFGRVRVVVFFDRLNCELSVVPPVGLAVVKFVRRREAEPVFDSPQMRI